MKNGDSSQDKEKAQDKGKAKALDGLDEGQDWDRGTPDVGDASAFSRVAKSAASLPAALFGGAIGTGETRASGAGEKGGSSRTGESLARVAESSVSTRASVPSLETIKPGQAQEHIANEEASFQAFLDSKTPDQLSAPDEWQGVQQPNASISEPQLQLQTTPLSVKEQQRRDGEELIALLSTDWETEPDYTLRDTISSSDMSSLRSALFGHAHGSRAPISWDNMLNFIPEYFQESASLSSRAVTEFLPQWGGLDTGEAWQAWIGQWSSVLTGYQDEVWGDLGSLIEEARVEVQHLQEAQPDENPPQLTALLRLRAILGHLRASEL